MSLDRLSRETFNALSPHIAVLDATGGVLLTNHAWRRFADANGGRACEVSEGANYLAVCDRANGPQRDAASTVAAAIRDVAAGRRAAFSVEYPCHAPSEQRWFRANISPLTIAGNVHVVVAHESVTDRVRAETQLDQFRSLDTLGRLAGGIVHDFNNLVSVVATSAELAQLELPADHRAQHEISVIRTATGRAAALSRQLLALSQRQPLEWITFDLDDVIVCLLPLLRRIVPERVEVHARRGPGERYVHGNRTQIEQILLNLTANAGAAMPDGGQLILHTEHASPADAPPECLTHGSWVRLVVHDTGAGMDAHIRARIFDPFFTTRAAGVGTGLGLATVHAIVTRHGGHISCTSEPGRGTTFVIDLPAAAGVGLTSGGVS